MFFKFLAKMDLIWVQSPNVLCFIQQLNHKCIMMYKILNDLAPAYLKKHFSYSSGTNKYSLRSNYILLTKPKTEFMKKVLFLFLLLLLLLLLLLFLFFFIC
jgi:hypothetical protein